MFKQLHELHVQSVHTLDHFPDRVIIILMLVCLL